MKKLTLIALILLLSVLGVTAQEHDPKLAKGKKVLVFPLDKKTTKSIVGNLRSWGYWEVVDKKEEADFILRFNFDRKTFGDRVGYVEFLDPTTYVPFETTYECGTDFSWTPNKRQLAKKIIRKRIRRDFKS